MHDDHHNYPSEPRVRYNRGIFGDARSPCTPHQAEEETSVQRGHRMIHDFFEQGNKATPCVLYIDELEALAHPEKREVYEPWQHQVRMEINGYSNASPAMVVMVTVPRREQIEQLSLLQCCFDHTATLDGTYPSPLKWVLYSVLVRNKGRSKLQANDENM